MMRYLAILMCFILLPQLLLPQIESGSNIFMFAKKLYEDKMYDLAAEQFHQFAEKNPDDPRAAEALYLAALSFFNINEYDKSKKEFLYLIIQFPNAKNLDHAQYKMAECFKALGDLAAAANAYQQLYVFYPKSSLAEQALFLAAKTFFDDKQYDKTIEILYEFLEVYPTSRLQNEVQLLIAEALIKNKDYDRASNMLEKILTMTESGPVNANALLIKANLAYELHRLSQAESDYQKLIEKYSSGGYTNDEKFKKILDDAFYFLAEILHLKGMYDRSNENLFRISNYETSAKALFLMGTNFVSAANYPKAIDAFQKFLAFPDSSQLIQAHLNMGDCYFNLKDNSNAILSYKQGLELCELKPKPLEDKGCDLIYMKIAEAYLNYNQPELAVSYLKKYRGLVKGEKKVAVIDYRIATIYQTKLRDYERAIRAYFDFIDTHPQSQLIDDAQWNLANCYQQIGNHFQALKEYQNLIDRYVASEFYPLARKRLAYLQNYFPTEKNVIKNLSGVIQQLAEQQINPALLYELGLTYFRELKEYRATINLYTKILNLPEEEHYSPDAMLFYLGRSYQLLGEKAIIESQDNDALLDSASLAFDRLIESYPNSNWADDAAFHIIEIKKLLFNSDEPNYFAQMKQALISFQNRYSDSSFLDRVSFELGSLLYSQDVFSSLDSLHIYASFQKIITDYPNSVLAPEARYYQSLFFYKTKNFDVAIDSLKSYVTDYPENHRTCEAYFKLAALFEQKLNYISASNYLNQIISKYFYCSLADTAKLKMGDYLTKQQNYLQALNYYMDIYEEYESDGIYFLNDDFIYSDAILQEIIFNIANILKAIDQRDEAIQFYQKYLVKFPRGKFRDIVLFSLGELFETSKKEDESKAIDYFQQLENSNSSSDLYIKSLIKIGDILFNQERYDEAKQNYLKALNLQLNDEDRMHSLSMEIICLYRLGQIAAADEQFNNFKRQFKDEKVRQAQIFLEKGNYFLREKIFDKAEKIFKSIRTDFKNTPEGWQAEYSLGKLYFILNNDDEALEVLTDILKKHSDEKLLAEVYITLGNFYYLQAKQIENAMLAYKSATEQKGISESSLKIAMHNLIKCYADLQLWDKAIALSRSYVEKFPIAEDTFEKKIQIGYYYYRLNEYDYAIQLFRKILPEADADNEPRIQFWIGECYFAKGQFQQAISEYLKIVYFSKPAKLTGQYKVTAQYQAAVSYIKLKKFENAMDLLKRIITEQGAESVFGKSAQEKLEEIHRMTDSNMQENL